MSCRSYDCRQDNRLKSRLQTTNELKLVDLPELCQGCRRPARLIYGARAQCDDHVVCADCGAYVFIPTFLLLLGCASQPSSGSVPARQPTTLHEEGKERVVPAGDPSLDRIPGTRPPKMLSSIVAHALCLECRGPSGWPADGRAILKTCVTQEGQVWSTKVILSGGEATDRTVTTMLGTWRFRPFLQEGQQTPFCSAFDIRFKGGTMEVVPPLNEK
jgi:hypothetical protein